MIAVMAAMNGDVVKMKIPRQLRNQLKLQGLRNVDNMSSVVTLAYASLDVMFVTVLLIVEEVTNNSSFHSIFYLIVY